MFEEQLAGQRLQCAQQGEERGGKEGRASQTKVRTWGLTSVRWDMISSRHPPSPAFPTLTFRRLCPARSCSTASQARATTNPVSIPPHPPLSDASQKETSAGPSTPPCDCQSPQQDQLPNLPVPVKVVR